MSTNTSINCPKCGSPYVKKADIGYRCESCSTEFVVHSEDKKVVAYDLPPKSINPPSHLTTTGDVVRCTRCGRLFKHRYEAYLWCDDANTVEHTFEKFEGRIAKGCQECGSWVYPSYDPCSNQQCHHFGKPTTIYIQKETDGKWEEYTPVPDPPAPPPPPPPPKKPGCGCGPTAFVFVLTLVVVFLTAWSLNAWKNSQALEAARKEHERVMTLRPWDNNPGTNQVILDNLSKEDKEWIGQWTKGEDWVWTTSYQTNHPENRWGRVTTTVSPKNPGNFKKFFIYSDWNRDDQDRWKITSEWRPFIQVP